jgi:hypothetical protein
MRSSSSTIRIRSPVTSPTVGQRASLFPPSGQVLAVR